MTQLRITREMQLQSQRDAAVKVLKLAYRKHWLDDDSIGWEELGNALLDALCNEMGTDEYILWVKQTRAKMQEPLHNLAKKMG